MPRRHVFSGCTSYCTFTSTRFDTYLALFKLKVTPGVPSFGLNWEALLAVLETQLFEQLRAGRKADMYSSSRSQ
jgi:hypothetical protein